MLKVTLNIVDIQCLVENLWILILCLDQQRASSEARRLTVSDKGLIGIFQDNCFDICNLHDEFLLISAMLESVKTAAENM